MTADPLLPPESKMDLPPPIPPQEVEMPQEAPVKRQGSEVNPEFLPAVSTDDPAPAHAQQSQAQASAAVAQALPTAPQAKPQSPPTHATNPVLAEDVDLIEKEWVEKAKAIVNHTKDDPNRQSKEINKMKADYIKKRYNKDIQVGE
jgi:hypothetical protein